MHAWRHSFLFLSLRTAVAFVCHMHGHVPSVRLVSSCDPICSALQSQVDPSQTVMCGHVCIICGWFA